MPSLMVIIAVLTIAGSMILIGTVITVRRYFDTQNQRAVNTRRRFQDVVSCSYCEEMTDNYIRLTLDGMNYIPVCFDCQCRTGIRCSDATISKLYFYQVAECDRD